MQTTYIEPPEIKEESSNAFKQGLFGQGYICTHCRSREKPALIKRGSILIELILWLCFLLPGLVYSIWRHSSRFKGCPDCRTQTMVKIDSPVGQQLVNM